MRKLYTPKYWIFLLFFSIFPLSWAQGPYVYDTRVDSIDIVNYEIHLDVTDFSGFILKAQTNIYFKPKVNGISFIDLDLKALTVDSVKDQNGNLLSFSPTTLGFRTNLGATYDIGDSTFVQVFYHGDPFSDPSFGGFYFQPGFAFSVGISLDEVPHNFGRTWYPCFDNFITRSKYDLYVTLPNTMNSIFSGLFQGSLINPDSTVTHYWKMDIPNTTHITSVCVANYVYVHRTFTNYAGNPVPVWLVARPTDTTNMVNSFVNLETAFDLFEERYGPYRFERVCYTLVPMSGGAMEHVMNIAYPNGLANGALTYQSVMVHELAHNWFGNTITPRTAQDMWIKEAFAVFSEYMFTEYTAGRAQYEAAVRNQHKSLLRLCHIDDNGYWPLSGISQEETYGSTSYEKGGDFVHTLRTYLGDSLFYTGLRQVINTNEFSDMDGMEMRDDLSAATGVNLDNFFNDWIFQGGWPHISIDSIESTPAGLGYNVTVYLKQKLVGRTGYSTQVPVLLSLRDASWNLHEVVIYSSGMNNSVTVTVPFAPTVAYLNRDEKISHAVTAMYQVVKTTGNIALTHANFNLNVQTNPDSSYVVVEHHWAAPDPVADWTKGFTISPQRFWRVDGIWNPGFTTNATISYCGRTTGTNAYLDHLLITGTEDSLILLYRPDRSVDWEEFPTYVVNVGNITDKLGSITINNLQKGEYALALKGQTIGIEEIVEEKANLYPNPTDGLFYIESLREYDRLMVTDMEGKVVFEKISPSQLLQLDATDWKLGVYVVSGYAGGRRIFSQKLMKF